MADVTGPIRSLPGSRHAAPEGIKCDFCNEADAVTRVQGETDSFGCEMHDLCRPCADRLREQCNSVEARTGQCDWCKGEATDLRDRRDIDEGMAGPVYRVCGGCAKRDEDRIREELADDDFWDCGDDY